MGFNLFGSSKGDSSTTNDNRQDNSTNITEGDLSDGAIRAEGDVTITDGGAFELAGGAVNGAYELAEAQTEAALDFGGAALQESFGFGRDSLGVVADNAAETYNAISENNRRTFDLVEQAIDPGSGNEKRSQTMTLGALAVAALVAWRALA